MEAYAGALQHLRQDLDLQRTAPGQIFKAEPREYASLPAYITAISEWRQVLISNGSAMPDELLCIWLKDRLRTYVPNLFAVIDANNEDVMAFTFPVFTARIITHLGTAGDAIANAAAASTANAALAAAVTNTAAAAAQQERCDPRQPRGQRNERFANETCRVCSQVGHHYCCTICRNIGHSESRCRDRPATTARPAANMLTFDDTDFPPPPPADGSWTASTTSPAPPTASYIVLRELSANASMFIPNETEHHSSNQPLACDTEYVPTDDFFMDTFMDTDDFFMDIIDSETDCTYDNTSTEPNLMDVVRFEDIDPEVMNGARTTVTSAIENTCVNTFLTEHLLRLISS